MDTYSDLFDQLGNIDSEKETASAAEFNYEGELIHSSDLPNFEEMTHIPSPISAINSPPAMDDPAAMDETKSPAMESPPSMPSQKEPIHSPPAMDGTKPAMTSQKEPPALHCETTSPPALNDEKPPASCKPRKFKGPFSSLRPKDPRIVLKRKPSPVREPSTPLQVPTFVKTPKRDMPPPRQDKGWKPVQSFKPLEEQIFHHSTNYVLALREGKFVLTNGFETASRKNEKYWQRALEEDLRYVAKSTRSVYCVDRLSYNLLAREPEKWPNHHPFKARVVVKVWETDPDLRPCTFCMSTNCSKWLAIRGGVQRFSRYEIDMLVH
ncbi:hypothetical protein AVEN_17532-1 [Araneus ventricosus]|uniref:Uncharacterized protein n=1 Tax=Araneus ventricosus TaxID=182803 RepID=A0A4Y2HF58_ARAVE|nr:hypothetical protein AVEN_17532-1 [Araneus ventricosus]